MANMGKSNTLSESSKPTVMYSIEKHQRSTINLNKVFYYYYFDQSCYWLTNLTVVLPKTLPIWKSPGEKSIHQCTVS